MAMMRRSGLSMVIVMPTLSVGNQSDEPIVAAVVPRLVVLVTKNVAYRIDAPSPMENDNGSNKNAPNQPASSRLDEAVPAIEKPAEDSSEQSNNCCMQPKDLDPHTSPLELHVEGVFQKISHVSFEARNGVVVAIPIDDPSHVRPKQIGERGVRVWLVIAVLMVHSMNGYPTRWAVLQVADAEDGERVFKPLWASEAAMSEQSVITDGDSKHTEHEMTCDRDDQSRPSEEPGDERKQSEDM